MEMEKKREIKHRFHEHPLVFVEDQSNEGEKAYCSACGDVISDPCFSCAPCNYHLHNNCALAPETISSHPLHPQHSGFFLQERPRPGDLVNQESKHDFHPHPLTFIPSPMDGFKSLYCSCCHEPLLERGSYSCVKSGCNYIVHVNCALEDDRFYEVVERESQWEELYGSSAESTQSSITRVVEVSEDGEATKIEHFSHEGHCLVLADKMEEETDRRCDGCMLPVSTLFYYCSESECHFYLHKNCAELPRVKHHWFRQSPATLDSTSFMWCDLCKRPCSGFFYEIEGYLEVCLRCADVPDVIEFQGHEHLLFYDFKCRERCNGCGADPGEEGAFRCGKCSFTLDFKCLSLPQSVVHKIDEHQLNLTYHDDNDYSKHLRCDICEGKRDRSLWMGSHCLLVMVTDIIMMFGFLGRLRTTLAARFAVSVAEEKFSSVLSLRATILLTSNVGGVDSSKMSAACVWLKMEGLEEFKGFRISFLLLRGLENFE
ncbi:hypothetical protein F3Y22_tig00111069pilonHSYRG00027 [Hibiscus syriacus]|uniref:Phorbol-ester/DAG-type domain-containing protein n=1 Tax=Hibiscus syriacus TaxID=106335 RepID=A0A6A2Z2Y2_HIBSY|nr:hypothetical protein F3Y22_tig00111069pilonHSYRG00027 [Hibiscus syriacus]